MFSASVAWNQGVQNRVSATSSMLEQMKSIKMMGLAEYFLKHIKELRQDEIALSKAFRSRIVLNQVLGEVPSPIRCLRKPTTALTLTGHRTADLVQVFTPVIIIAAAVFWTSRQADERLSVAKAFTSLAIVTLVSSPLALLVHVRSTVAASLGCFSRIQKFLLLDGRTDDGTFVRQSDHPPGDIELHPYSLPAIELRGASFKAGNGTVLLEEADLCVKGGSCHMVTGPVGSGKSTALKAALGELRLTSGFAKVKGDSVAYCAQTPWLRNVSIRENVVGGAEFGFDAEWYGKVISACALDRDFAMAPRWDEQAVGSGGLSLSGGQQQRVVSSAFLSSLSSRGFPEYTWH